jgi:hypothetical protein
MKIQYTVRTQKMIQNPGSQMNQKMNMKTCRTIKIPIKLFNMKFVIPSVDVEAIPECG